MHGEVAIDNNKVENSISPNSVGKRNWLFLDPTNPRYRQETSFASYFTECVFFVTSGIVSGTYSVI
jgi:hypothetical protein